MNNWSAVNWGILLYDSPKDFAYADWSDNHISFLNKDTREPIFEATFSSAGSRSVSVEHPNVLNLHLC